MQDCGWIVAQYGGRLTHYWHCRRIVQLWTHLHITSLMFRYLNYYSAKNAGLYIMATPPGEAISVIPVQVNCLEIITSSLFRWPARVFPTISSHLFREGKDQARNRSFISWTPFLGLWFRQIAVFFTENIIWKPILVETNLKGAWLVVEDSKKIHSCNSGAEELRGLAKMEIHLPSTPKVTGVLFCLTLRPD